MDTNLHHTARIAAGYVRHNRIDLAGLTALIATVHATLSQPDVLSPTPPAERPKPFCSIKASVRDDYIVCLEDGARLKMLKRYLRARFDMSPEDYRRKWGLPASYPMAAPNYSAARSDFAKHSGLGTKNRGYSRPNGHGRA